MVLLQNDWFTIENPMKIGGLVKGSIHGATPK